VTAARAYAALVLDPIQNGLRLHHRLGPVFAIDPPFTRGRRGRRGVLIAREDLAARVLEHPEEFHTVGLSLVRGPAGSAQRRLRDGMIRMNGPEQTALRRDYAPVLSMNRVSAQTQEIRDIANAEIAGWPLGTPFDGLAALKRIVRRAAASLMFNAAADESALALAALLERHAVLQYSPLPLIAPVALPGSPYERLLRHAERTERALIEWIGKRRSAANADDMVSRICGARTEGGAPLCPSAQAAQLWTLYGASFETTATALCWTVLHLVWNPAVARRLLDELTQSADRSPFLSAVVTEALRMSPPVPYQIRRAVSDSELGGVRLTRGDRIFISAAVMNRDPELYTAPHKFAPERWAAMEGSAFRPLAFSAGPRRCLGFNFAQQVIKTTLAALWPALRLEVPRHARIGVRLAITQSPSQLPLVARSQDGEFSGARFTGPAARQMSHT
jgi:cytochrome P450